MRLYLNYRILITKRAQKFLDALDIIERTEIVLKIEDLITPDIKFLNIKKLQGYKDLYRITIHDIRVIYKVDESNKLFIVGAVGKRKDIYALLKRISI